MAIKVTTLGGNVSDLNYSDNLATVGDALKAAGVEPDKKATVTVNGQPAKLDQPVKDNDLVVVTPKIANG